MMLRKLIGFTVLATFAILFAQIPSSTACMCMPEHSQTSYCRADYVILARVLRKAARKIKGDSVYKIEIKKTYKKSSRTDEYLKDGRLLTPSADSMCGVNLTVGKLYLIAGKSSKLSLCNYVKEYSQMSIVERRGFAGAYKKGCACEIIPMFRLEGFHLHEGECNWRPSSKCETDFGVCVPSRGHLTDMGKPIKCHWRNSQPYATCLNKSFLESRYHHV